MLNHLTHAQGVILSVSLIASCGSKFDKKAKEDPSVSSENLACVEQKSPTEFVTNVIQDMTGRPPRPSELAVISEKFDAANFVDATLDSALFDDAITRFVSNLLRLSNLKANPQSRDQNEAVLIEDLKNEPIILVQRNKDKPWGWFFQTRDIYCTSRTGALYDYPLVDTTGFSSCTLPKDRAGLLSLVSFLRSTSPADKPQGFYKTNNNYHRVASAIYVATGVQLLAATNGPKGDGPGMPMAPCVPTTDVRASKGGTIFGTAAIPQVGATCAGCHSPNMGPLSIAFRKFGSQGELITRSTVSRYLDDEDNVTPTSEMIAIFNEDNSCWSPDGKSLPVPFNGLSGLGKVIADSNTLGKALGQQIPQHLSNIASDDNMAASIESSFNGRRKTLKDAMRGYFLSSSYRCKTKG